ncbi:(2Fe-2S)-binding protein [Fulvivirgaceae bacterium PWU4]|uniref:(2Fe-2S)-binding protein n=1 Tax=Chryseosolibacter histidini TaxID=2782349 RepID=A0AAP2GMS5_9BACT|nr:2Fe-2S iron-sulfur cluster-binding protein [Chryseosolibacter histidini]MBT1701559.1 (2Fe-2S)-binding protein [Chryseosolibacter histidini]
MIIFDVRNAAGELQTLELPTDINLSLMEVLKASEYPIAATCGGMALCATCHIEVLKGAEKLGPPTDAELDMIDTLPHATAHSRLACQIRLGEQLNGAVIVLKG